MTTTDPTPARVGWLERFAPLGAVIFSVWMLVSFFWSGDYDDTAQSVLDYAERDEAQIVSLLILGLATPLLIGGFLAALLARFSPVEPALRALTVIGGTLFIAFFTVAALLWSAPLLDSSLSAENAASYLMLDDAGWVLIGASGVSAALMIIGTSLAALRHRWVPAWLGWVSLALGVVALATVAALGIFAWCIWFIGAGLLLTLRGDRTARAA
jgi:hypothetical protein